ncbi:hypothetical protein CF166_13760 [Amycolatopsis sp. KNN50.9b]|nr:hypothetical protein CF166_13760 [Amycolatopsis sp. KNN50.9b]
MLTAITGAVVTVATGGAALPAFATAVLAAGDEAGKQAVALDGVSYASVADTFLAKSADLVGQTAAAIRANVVPRLEQARRRSPESRRCRPGSATPGSSTRGPPRRSPPAWPRPPGRSRRA